MVANKNQVKQTIQVDIIPLTMSTIDGNDSQPFEVKVTPANVNVESYNWMWKAPQKSGNSPQVHFATPNKQDTLIKKAHWFAYPDSRLQKITGWDCEYTIDCEVTIDGIKYRTSTPATFHVYLPDPPAVTSWPRIEGFPTIATRQEDDFTEWYVSSLGTLKRRSPQVTSYIPITSQFYDKVVTVHEGHHVIQHTTGVQTLTSHTLWDATQLFHNTLKSLKSTVSEADLKRQINNAIATQNALDNNLAQMESRAREKEAFSKSNQVPPHYLEFNVL